MNDLLSVLKRFQEVLRLFESYIRLLDIAVGLSSSLVDNKALLNLFHGGRVFTPCYMNGAGDCENIATIMDQRYVESVLYSLDKE
jgi:hypothetical protein